MPAGAKKRKAKAPTVAQLRDRAKKLGVELPPKAKKPEIAALVKEAEELYSLPVLFPLVRGLRKRARVQSVFGPFAAYTMVEMPTDLAQQLFDDLDLGKFRATSAVDGAERELADLRERAPAIADSGAAAAALRMAREVDDPYNSATSKSMCAKQLREALTELRDRAPAKEEADGVDGLAADVAAKQSGS